MTYLIILLPLPILLVISYYLNHKKLYERTGNIYLVSFFEGLGTYLVVLALLLEGFIVHPFLQVIILLVGLFIVAYTKNTITEKVFEMDIQIETLKNSFVIFTSTILLFYVLLSVFRFQPVYLQIIYALSITVIFNIFTYFFKKIFSSLYDRIEANLSLYVSFRAWYLYLIVFGLIFMILIFNFPKVSVNQSLNLNNSNPYFVKPIDSNQLMNRYDINQLLDFDLDIDDYSRPYMNHVGDHVFIYIDRTVIIYDVKAGEVIYSGLIQDEINGITINTINQESNEEIFKINCDGTSNCTEYYYKFEYGGIIYQTIEPIIKIDDLSYEYSNEAIFNKDIIHLFKDEVIDSKVKTADDRPFFGFGYSNAFVSDIDNYEGLIEYIQVERFDDSINIQLYQVVEKDIDVVLPFYSHYRFGMLVFIFIMGFVPISNYDIYRTEVSFKNQINKR
jgi:hypothetical protein